MFMPLLWCPVLFWLGWHDQPWVALLWSGLCGYAEVALQRWLARRWTHRKRSAKVAAA